tara:strand:- start:131 stop:586 length:456 start_codon:yes stop_codon:yes gene_type:complete
MIAFISHRGNLKGKDLNLENSPQQIEKVIKKGYECETDLWLVKNELFLGHDNPEYKVTIDWLHEFKDKLWIHTKNFEALNFLSKSNGDLHYFWHNLDDYTLTSKNYIWTFPEKYISKNSVIVKLDYEENYLMKNNLFGICSDYIESYKGEI